MVVFLFLKCFNNKRMNKNKIFFAPLCVVALLVSCDTNVLPTTSHEGVTSSGTLTSKNSDSSFDGKTTSLTSEEKSETSHPNEETSESSSNESSTSEENSTKHEYFLPGINSSFVNVVTQSSDRYVTTLTIKDLDTNLSADFVTYDPLNNPYSDIDTDEEKETFYATYTPAHSAIDAKYRSEMGLLSGNNTDSKYLPKDNAKKDTSKINSLRSKTLNYIVNSETNNKDAYIFYNLDGTFTPIYYEGAYWTMNETAAYLFGFGKCPINQDYDKYEAKELESSKTWWKYGRVNRGFYDGPVKEKYAYESFFVGMENKDIYYTETDFGNSTYYNETVYDEQYKPMPYIKKDNEGKYNIFTSTPGDRGVLRFVFTSVFENVLPRAYKASHASEISNENYKNVYYNRVYYTFNHYNDWHEFLNYEDGWGQAFGNIIRGNSYNEMDKVTDKNYAPIPNDKSLIEIIDAYKNK